MHENFIDGRFVRSASASAFDVVNPSRNEVISRAPDSTEAEVDEAVAAARVAQKGWERRPAIERAGHLREIAAGIRQKVEQIARVITEEQGKTLPLARIEVQFTADYIDYMAEWARRIEGEIIPSDRPGETILLFRQALGVVGGILPWNFPFFLIARKMAPALLTGNAVVIKPSEETPNNAALFAEIVAASGLPRGIFNLVYGRGRSVGEAISRHPGIDLISFTGSVETGSAIMRSASANITKVNLELGGKAPAIVMDDADLGLAARAITQSRIINTGQVCNCAERVYVHRAVRDRFLELLVEEMAKTRFGDVGADESLDMGPLISAAQRDKVQQMLARAVAGGAEVLTGGKADDRSGGFYFEPTVVAGVDHGHEIMRKEIFGPVIPVAEFSTLDEAIDKANDTDYGLTSSIFTTSVTTAMRACRWIKFGETYINRENFEAMQGFHAGVRKSGIGGADGKHGIYEFTSTHTVYIADDR